MATGYFKGEWAKSGLICRSVGTISRTKSFTFSFSKSTQAILYTFGGTDRSSEYIILGQTAASEYTSYAIPVKEQSIYSFNNSTLGQLTMSSSGSNAYVYLLIFTDPTGVTWE